MMLIIISKEKQNYIKFKISIFILGFFAIIFSETTIRFIENNLIENVKILIIPFIITLTFYQFIKFNLKKNYKNIRS